VDGAPLARILNSSSRLELGTDLLVDHTFSSKPARGHYVDYYEKVSTYAAILTNQAQGIDTSATAQTSRPLAAEDEDDSPFHYIETASSRAGISLLTERLKVNRIGIIGLGGTGSYVLDLLAKCPVREIHLFDGDWFLTHNAFRAPGAPTLAELEARPSKVTWFATCYEKMHRRIGPHEIYIRAETIDELQSLDFVFICIDCNDDKARIIVALETWGISFIDVGMGIQICCEQLSGIVRVTTSTTTNREQAKKRIPHKDSGLDDEYSKNIQVADMNCLNASLAVIKWKKLAGFYADLEREHNTLYTIDGNDITNEDYEDKHS
jgi:tRNA A37 threonylcarbamoyladenosine dehydratase